METTINFFIIRMEHCEQGAPMGMCLAMLALMGTYERLHAQRVIFERPCSMEKSLCWLSLWEHFACFVLKYHVLMFTCSFDGVC